MDHLFQVAYLMLPVYAANMAAPFARLMPGTPRPVCERWLGSHKTWRGYALALVAATATVGLQAGIRWRGDLIDYGHPLSLGLICGAAAMAGDSAKSFVKRRLGIAPGRPWIPADQLDYVVAGLLALSTRYTFQAWEVAVILAASFVGALLANRLAARWGIKQTPW